MIGNSTTGRNAADFGTHDRLSNVNSSDLHASIPQAFQAAGPDAPIFIIMPFGQDTATDLKAGVETARATNPSGHPISIIDLGASGAKCLAADGYWCGLHPSMRAHATFAAQILAQVGRRLPTGKNTP